MTTASRLNLPIRSVLRRHRGVTSQQLQLQTPSTRSPPPSLSFNFPFQQLPSHLSILTASKPDSDSTMSKLIGSDTPDSVKNSKGLHLVTQSTPNGQKVQILLEELKLKYDTQWDTTVINIMTNEQKKDWFLRLDPNGRIPILLDNSLSPPFPVMETSAELLYLEKKYDKEDAFGFKDDLERNEALQWLFFWHGSGSFFFPALPIRFSGSVRAVINDVCQEHHIKAKQTTSPNSRKKNYPTQSSVSETKLSAYTASSRSVSQGNTPANHANTLLAKAKGSTPSPTLELGLG